MNESYTLYADKLNEEYHIVFKQVELYMMTANIDTFTQEEQLSELLDIFLSAQSAGKPVESVVGYDLEPFCRAFCAEYGVKNRLLNVLDNLRSLAKGMLVIAGLDILCMEWDASADFWSAISSLNVSGYLIGILIAMALNMATNLIVRRLMFRRKRVSMKLLNGISLSVAVVSFAVIFLFLNLNSTNFFGCPVWVLLLCGVGYLAVYYPFNYKRVKEQKSQKIRFRDMVSVEMDKTFPEEMEKKYQKANCRSIQKGKGPLPMEVFLKKEEKECGKIANLKWFYGSAPVAITGIGMLLIEFDSWWDGLVYAAVMLTVEGLVMFGMWRFVKKTVARRREWINTKREALSAEESA